MEQNYYQLCDNRYDEAFDTIKLLERYPWIGCKYAYSECRPLIIGDSHYSTNEDGNFCQEEYENMKNDKFYTRGIVNTVVVNKCDGKQTWKMFEGLLNTFIEVSPDNVKRFWSKVSFYNFIQEPMKSSNAKPTNDDRIIGWKCLADVAKILHPTTILILGTRNWYGLDALDSIDGVSRDGFNWDETHKISNTTPGTAKIMLSNEVIPINLIHHTSQGYCVHAWRDYLKMKEPEMMSYLE